MLPAAVPEHDLTGVLSPIAQGAHSSRVAVAPTASTGGEREPHRPMVAGFTLMSNSSIGHSRRGLEQVDEPVEEVCRVVRSRCCLRVVLHREGEEIACGRT